VPASDDLRVRRLVDRALVHDAILESAFAMDRNGVSRHLVNNQLIEVEGDEASAQTYVYVTEHGADGRPSPWSQGARRWIDRWRRAGGGWRLVDRIDETTRVRGELMISADEAATRARRRGVTTN
jgi:hypothetical protein